MSLRLNGFVALLILIAEPLASNGGKVGGDISPDSKEYLTCPLSDNLQSENRRGTDGSGLCVFASMRHTGIWQDDPLFAKMLDYMEKYPGGGFPRKVDLMLKKASSELGLPMPEYIQIEDNDIEILKLASRCRYMPCITYGYSATGRYGGRMIYHMVNLIHASDNWFCVLDNNFIGSRNVEWMTRQEFERAYTATGTGWAIVLLTMPTAPQPWNED